jgi:Fe/S biogenesis protein NfuA
MATTRDGDQGGPIVAISQAAREKVLEILDSQGIRGRGAIRIGVQGRGPAGFNYSMALEEDVEPEAGDAVQDEGDFKVLVDEATLPKLRGATVDFVGQLMGGGFKIENPNSVWDDPIAAEVQRILYTQINPGVASHGGHIELLDVKDDNAYIRMGGGCQGCGMADVTLKQGVETLLKQHVPQIKAVIDTTDHAGGNNPYFQQAKGGGGPHHQPSKGGGGQSPYYQPAKGGGGGCGAPGCGAGGCGGGAHAQGAPHYAPSKG